MCIGQDALGQNEEIPVRVRNSPDFLMEERKRVPD